MKKKVMIVFGTRPEAIKLAPLVLAFKEGNEFDVSVTVTAQHKEMLYQVLDQFEIEPDFDLEIMKPKQSLFELTSRLVTGLQKVYEEAKPDLIIVQGDTTTTFIGALAAFYLKIPVAHVEAGLRSENMGHPFPEEANRVLTSSITDIHFPPTKSAQDNLLKQGIDKEKMHLVGNTIIDALNYIVQKSGSEVSPEKDYILVTAHRRENWGEPIENLCKAMKSVVEQKNDIRFIFSVHKNPIVRDSVNKILGDVEQVELVEPQGYEDFIQLLNQCYFVLSDSGGIQEEAPALGKPVLVFRKTTERPEGVEAGVVKLIGNKKDRIEREVLALLDDKELYRSMSKAKNLYGDGTSSKQIVEVVRNYFS